MKPGELVRVAMQPSDLPTHQIVGSVGILEEVSGCYGKIQCLKIGGYTGGGGYVPLECLEIEASSEWVEARQAYEVRMEEELRLGLQRARRKQEKVAKIVERYGITVEDVSAIVDEMNRE